jgi:hypothetical protein
MTPEDFDRLSTTPLTIKAQTPARGDRTAQNEPSPSFGAVLPILETAPNRA